MLAIDKSQLLYIQYTNVVTCYPTQDKTHRLVVCGYYSHIAITLFTENPDFSLFVSNVLRKESELCKFCGSKEGNFSDRCVYIHCKLRKSL